jgi:hypothetical protein
MGRAASELIRRGLHYQLGTRKLNGLLVFDAPAGVIEAFALLTSTSTTSSSGHGIGRRIESWRNQG